LAGVLLWGCDDDRGGDTGSHCTTGDDCSAELVCRDGTCQYPGDADADADSDLDACDASCDEPCCDQGLRCFSGSCIPDNGTCAEEETCQNDTQCVDGVCVPYGVDPVGDFDELCTIELRPGLFRTVLQCEWTGPPEGDPYPNHMHVESTPLVMDFAIDRGPDDPPRPSIVFIATDRFTHTESGVIRIIDGATCEQLATLADPFVQAAGTPAIGDVDDDGRPDIAAPMEGGGVAVWRWDEGVRQWRLLWRDAGRVATAMHALFMADIDDDARTEILAGGIVYDAAGAVMSTTVGQPLLPNHEAYAWAQPAVVADVDGDVVPELLLGDSIWAWDAVSADLVQEASVPGTASSGGVAVANFGDFGEATGDAPGRPELVVPLQSGLQIETISGSVLFGPIPIPGGTYVDTPTVADFDGDGVPEVGLAGGSTYTVFDMACVADGGPGLCDTGRNDGMLWSFQMYREAGGTTVFDFEGDGRAEVVTSDLCFVRVLDGRDGAVVWSRGRSSGTWYELAVVADVDADYHAEIVSGSEAVCLPAFGLTCPTVDPYAPGLRCESDGDCPTPLSSCDSGLCRCAQASDCGDPDLTCTDPLPGSLGTGMVCRPAGRLQHGVRVYSDFRDRWAGSRMLWNQYAYSVTNVRDDGTIPRGSEVLPNWEQPGLNNFRQNVQAQGFDLDDSPDLTVGHLDAPECNTEEATQPLSARVCNRGTLPVAAGVDLSFHIGSPDGEVVCSATTQDVLERGACEDVTCLWEGITLDTDYEVHAVVDSDDEMSVAECHEDNNAGGTEVRCPPSLI
jgi:hypothetical protein